MDATAIAIAVIGTLVFFGVLIWKAVWFVRKMNESEAAAQSDAAAADERDPGPSS